VLEIVPPHSCEAPPIDLVLKHYIHNAMALTRADARQLAFDSEWEWTRHQLQCETGALQLTVKLPRAARRGLDSQAGLQCQSRRRRACDGNDRRVVQSRRQPVDEKYPRLSMGTVR
jgi:hypothetical protein